MSLRRSLSALTAGLAVLTLVTAFTMVGMTTYLNHAATEVQSALHSVTLTQDMEIDLLTHARAPDRASRMRVESNLLRKLSTADEYMPGGDEQIALGEARHDIAFYIQDAWRSPLQQGEALPSFRNAFDSLVRLLEVNVQNAEEVEQQSRFWIAWGTRLGFGVAFVLVTGVSAALVWLRRIALRPVFAIRDAMRSFASGKRDVRAPETGEEELRGIASQFNEMADVLMKEHENRLTFLAGVAHDLRNPLMPLKMSTSLLSVDGKLPPEEQIRTIMSVVKRQVDRLDRMVGDLLDACGIESGRLELRLQNNDARALVQEVFELYKTSSPNHNIHVHIPEDPVTVRCDALRLEQVLNNLVSNAVKYSPGGGTVDIALRRSDGEAMFRVSDQGIGIAPSELSHIFEPFRRSASVKENISGVGLGLSVTRRIVEAHGGHIHVESEPGKGTTFEVRLPLAA